MYKKYMVLLFVGISIVALSFSATADEENIPELEERNNEEEPLILPPRSEETVEHDSSKGKEDYENLVGEDCDQDTPHILGTVDDEETKDPKKVDREYENVVGEDCDQDTPHILDIDNDKENNEENIDAGLSTTKISDEIKGNNLSYILVIGAIGTIGLLLIILKKKE